MNENLPIELKNIAPENVRRIQLYAPAKNFAWKKITAVKLANGTFQIEKLTEKQAFHENIYTANAIFDHEIFSFFGNGLMQMEISDDEFTYNFRAAKKRILFNRKKLKNTQNKIQLSQDRQKNYILNEGMKIQPLVDLGIFHPDFSLVKKSYAKFKQINRFVEFIDDLLKDLPPPPQERPFTIVDFGCGKSYLTFILYFYFTQILKWDVRMIGMDLKADVIDSCNEIAKKYKYHNLSFLCGDISKYQTDSPIDMIVTLHACDTATDYALYHAISRSVRYIISVPCCQHELNKQFKSENFSVFSDYGLIQERFCTLLTDTIRAELLKSCSYNVQIMEFVDICHTPKNMMLRAELRKTQNPDSQAHLQTVEKLMQEFSVTPTLYKLIKEK